MNAALESPGPARKLRDETRSLIRIHLLAFGAAVLVLGLLGAAMVHFLLFGPAPAGLPGRLFSWTSLVLTLAAVAACGGWARRSERVDRLVRENLLLNYLAHRKDLEAWLSSELVGSKAGLARRLIERRLDRGLARSRWVPLKRGHFLAMALVLAACPGLALLHIVLGLSPARCVEAYLRGILPGETGAPPRIAALSPGERWVREGDLGRVEVTFDRDLQVPARVTARSEAGAASSDLARVAPARYRASLLPCRGKVALQVAVGRRLSPEFEYQVYPPLPVEVREARWFDGRGRELGNSSAGPSPITVPEGALVRFLLGVSPCPLAAFGLGGRRSGELGLRSTGPGAFEAEARLFEDESFRTFWQVPGAAAQLGRELAFRVQALPAPEPEIVFPREGERVEARRIWVTCRSTYEGNVVRGYVLCSDYLNLQWTWELPVERRGEGEWAFEFDLPLHRLNLGSARVLGLCAALEAEGAITKTGISPVVNVLLPPGPRGDLARTSEERPGGAAAAAGDGSPGDAPSRSDAGSPELVKGDPAASQRGRERKEGGCPSCGGT